MAQWYYLENGEQRGPISEEEILSLVAQGTVKSEDYVWNSEMSDWQPAGSVPALRSGPPVPPMPGSDVQGRQPYTSATRRAEGESITNYLPWAIAATILCCLPAGVASIIYSVKAGSAQQNGDMLVAQEAAGKAKTWLIVSVVVGLVSTIVGFALGIFGAVAEAQ